MRIIPNMTFAPHFRFRHGRFTRLCLQLGLFCFFAGGLASAWAHEGTVFTHVLNVKVSPDAGLLEISDEITIEGTVPDSFGLHKQLLLDLAGEPLEPDSVSGELAHYAIPPDTRKLELQYEGMLGSTPECDWLRERCRLISADGVYLDGGSAWYADHPDVQHRFRMTVALPENWVSLSQGTASDRDHWQESQPQESLYLIAGEFHVYQDDKDDPRAMVYLQNPDEALAKQYLEATQTYLQHYSQLLGDYPYSKFVTVESFWETGWGMPSFTLLGSKVIRLPFILYTSLPHEILHNWWGNSVYPSTGQGNWTEGLTAYLADHALREQRGGGADYRRDALRNYSVFTSDERDFPLAQFRSRHDGSSQAVGYNKSLMFFHMLRKKLGDDAFFAGLQQFYARYRFQRAGFPEIKTSLQNASEVPLDAFFAAWTTRVGAPKLALANVVQGEGQVSLELQQTQQAEAFPLNVPVLLRYASGETETRIIAMHEKSQQVQWAVSGELVEVSVDPQFDVMRLPYDEELPPSLNILTAARTIKVESDSLPEAQQGVVAQWLEALETRGVRLVDDGADVPTVRFTQPMPATPAIPELSGALEGVMGVVAESDSRFVVAAPDAEVLSLLLRKMPHYGKYSYIAFDATSGRNVAKGQWPPKNSPLTWRAAR